MIIQFDAHTQFITLRFGQNTSATIVEYFELAGESRGIFVGLGEGPERTTLLATMVATNLTDFAMIPRFLSEFEQRFNIPAPPILTEDWQRIQDLCREIGKISMAS